MTAKRLPPWIRSSLKTDKGFTHVHKLVGGLGLHTVCEEARCPNRHECWNSGTATVMILGDLCTRNCGFCAIRAGRPTTLDRDEPRRVAEAAAKMKLKHIVITSVARDDQPDGGAGIFAETIRALQAALPDCTIEVLTPDFEAVESSLITVLEAGPHVFNHNVETVKRLQPIVRPQASYGRSLETLKYAAEWESDIEVKSGLMLGLGETDEEITETLADMRAAGCSMVTIGQYLRPSTRHLDIDRFVPPEKFAAFGDMARELGFSGVASGPMVRSSYKAETLYANTRAAQQKSLVPSIG